MTIQITKEPLTSLTEQDAVYKLRWLGQAGFEVFTAGLHIMIDPYLSDSLAKKYAGKEFAHQRMMASPIAPEEVSGIDYILTTHRHSDHIDPETTPVIMENNPECILFAPRAEMDHVLSLGIDKKRVKFINAGESITLSEEVGITVIPSAHEELKQDTDGNHHFLGYIISSKGINLYHSGDCAPFNAQSTLLKEHKVDIAMLPINGRDEFRASRGVPGNMGIAEAIALCLESDIKKLICHHFGMFSFNTADMCTVGRELEKVSEDDLAVILPDQDTAIAINQQ